jgi:hypothetical protein
MTALALMPSSHLVISAGRRGPLDTTGCRISGTNWPCTSMSGRGKLAVAWCERGVRWTLVLFEEGNYSDLDTRSWYCVGSGVRVVEGAVHAP